MKNNKMYLVTINLVWLALFFSGCKEYTTKTKINTDGSCERIVIVEGDTAGIAYLPFQIPVDNSWKIETKKSDRDSSKFVYTAAKIFDNVNELNNVYKDSNKIGVEVNFEKKFRWFYTYYEYKETYSAYFPYKMIPLKEYLTEQEYESYLNDDTTSTLKNRLEKYAGENFLDYFLSEFLKVCKEYGINEVNENSVKKNRQIILDYIDHSESSSSESDFEKLALFLSETFKSQSIMNLKPFFNKIISEIEKKIEWIGGANGTYINQVNMPGIILSTNSKSINGNIAEWKVDANKFLYDDLVMKVESRRANLWTFIVTGLLVIGLIVSLLLPRLRKK